MLYATKIKMKTGCEHSNSTLEIADIYISGGLNPGFASKEAIHNHLKINPKTICVNIPPYPYLVPVTSVTGEKYVRSQANDTSSDNLLKLLRI